MRVAWPPQQRQPLTLRLHHFKTLAVPSVGAQTPNTLHQHERLTMSSSARQKAITGLLALVLASGCGLPLWGQSTFGTILGSVLDAKGGAIPGVEITLTDEGTNVVRTTKTNEAGIFEFVNLVAGFYRLEVRQEGFKTFVQEGIELSSRQIIRIDPVMDLGAVVETVTVRPVPGLIETETGTISATVQGGMPFFLSPSTISQRPWDQMRLGWCRAPAAPPVSPWPACITASRNSRWTESSCRWGRADGPVP